MTAGDFAGASALLIGTGTHRPESDLPDLPAVSRTLHDLRTALLETCGLADVRVGLDLASPLELGAAVSEAAATAGGPLIVYYAGHGLVSRRGSLHLAAGVTRSGPLHLEHTALPYDTVRRYLLDNVDAPVAVILDCCFSGRAIEGMSALDEVAGLTEITGAYVLTSAGRSEPAFAPEGARYTAFSGALLRLLREGDPGGPPYLTLQHIHRHLSRTLPAAGFPRPRARSTGRVAELALARNPAHGAGAEGVRLSPSGLPGGAPYKGLAAFGETDAALFFGRERLVAELIRRLTALEADPAPLIVTGPSGSGKSSLLRAGLAPALRQGALGTPRTVAVITPGEPVPGTPDVLIVDQIEEDLEAAAGLCARPGLTVLAVRADFLGRCAGHPALRPALERGQVVTGPMTPGELRAAIERPAAAAGLRLEPGLAELLLRDLGAEAGRLPLLSHALLATWQQRRRDVLTVAGYRQTGGIHGALAATADDVLASLPEPEAAKAVFLRLVHVGDGTDDTRRRVTRTQLAAELPPPATSPATRRTPSSVGPAEVGDAAEGAAGEASVVSGSGEAASSAEVSSAASAGEVIEAFAADDARLLTLDGDTVTITHEALLTAWPTLRGWIEADRAALLVEQRLVEAARSWEGDQAGLYQGGRLELARAWASGRVPGPLVARFLAASEALARRRARVRVALVSVLSGLLVVSLVASGLAVLKYQDAERERRIAAARARVFQADVVRQADPLAALRLGIEAVTTEPGVITESALAADALSIAYRGRLTGFTASVSAVAVSPDGRRGLAGDFQGTLGYWDLDRRVKLSTLPAAGKGPLYSARFDHTGRRAVVTWQEVAPEIWDLTSVPRLVGSLGEPADHAEFYAGGQRVATASKRGVELWDVRGEPRSLARFGPPVTKLAVSGQPREDPGGAGQAPRGSGGSRQAPRDSGGSRQAPRDSGGAGSVRGSSGGAGEVLVAVDAAGAGRVWRWSAGGARSEPLPVPETETNPSTGVALTGDGTLAVVGDRVWDVQGRPELVGYLTGHEGFIADAAFSPDGGMLATAGEDYSAIVWHLGDPRSPRIRARLAGHTAEVTGVAFGPGGRLLTGSGDASAIVWRYADPPAAEVLPVSAVQIAAGGTARLTRTLADPATATLWAPSGQVASFPSAAGGVALSADGRTALVGGETGAVLRGPDGTMRTLAAGMRVRSVALSPDGRLALIGGPDGVALWAADGRAPGNTATSGNTATPGGTATPDGARTPGNTATPGGAGMPGTETRLPGATAFTVAMGAGFGVVGREDGRVALWDLRDPVRPRRADLVDGHSGQVRALAVHDGLVLSGGEDRKAVLWEVGEGLRLRAAGSMGGHGGAVHEVALSADGRVAATAALDETVAVWLVRDRSGPRRIHTLAGAGEGVAFGPGTYSLLASTVQGGVNQWDFRYLAEVIDRPLAAACALAGCEKGRDNGGE
ncbi:hypothetical protein [Nonomuraea typhae]|uniref:Novel STAND NTPase 1 domain-containing protein n=1 Tax=Nonomuraea typhae TaxID=2603600 RepID=A0ABW7YV86_9ACTN